MPASHVCTAVWEFPFAISRMPSNVFSRASTRALGAYAIEARGPLSYSNPQSQSGSFVARCIIRIAPPLESKIGPSFFSSQAASPAAVFSSKDWVDLSTGGSCISANAIQ